jgi:hypothetical protein
MAAEDAEKKLEWVVVLKDGTIIRARYAKEFKDGDAKKLKVCGVDGCVENYDHDQIFSMKEFEIRDTPETTRLRKRVAELEQMQAKKELPNGAAATENLVLKHKYMKINDEWIKLPDMDLSKNSSQTRPFVPRSNEYYYRTKSGIVCVGKRSDRPKNSKEITAEVNEQKQEEYESTLPTFGVGEFGILKNRVTIRQIIGPHDMICEIAMPGRLEDFNIWIHGFSTEGCFDNAVLKSEIAIAFVGSKAYTSVLGAQKTLLLAVPLEKVKRGLSDIELDQLKKQINITD